MGKIGKNRYAGLFGIGRQLGMDSDALHEQVYLWTGKEKLTLLSDAELRDVETRLGGLKDSSLRYKRTDVGGNDDTVAQRRKIYMLTRTLGWNDDNRRISAFAKRITGVARIEWLSTAQCNMVIEGLKDMVSRERRKCGT